MNGFAVLFAMAAIGIDYGWQPMPNGQLEYIVQIEPNLLDALRNGQDIVSKIPPEVQNVRQVRIRVGHGSVPRISSATGAINNSIQNSTNLGSQSGPGSYSPATGTAAGGVPLLNLPPPPWTNTEKSQLRSVLVRNGGRGTNPASSTNGNNSTYPSRPLATTGSMSNNPSSPLGMTRPQSSPALSSPANSSAFSTPATSGGAFPAIRVTNPSDSSFGGTAPKPPTNNGPLLGPPSPSAPANDEILPRRPISSPGTGSAQFPIRDPQARTGNSASTPASKQNRTKASRHSKLMDLVRENTASKTPSAGPSVPLSAMTDGTSAASGKPVINEEEANQLLEAQAKKPWMPLVYTSLALFASLAANLYLGWIAIGVYRRYRQVVSQLRDATAY